MFVAKYRSDGIFVSSATNSFNPSYSTTVNGADGYGIAVSVDGKSVFVTGRISRSTGADVMFVIKYNAALTVVQWADYRAADLGSCGNAVAVSPDGLYVYATGNWVNTAGNIG